MTEKLIKIGRHNYMGIADRRRGKGDKTCLHWWPGPLPPCPHRPYFRSLVAQHFNQKDLASSLTSGAKHGRLFRCLLVVVTKNDGKASAALWPSRPVLPLNRLFGRNCGLWGVAWNACKDCSWCTQRHSGDRLSTSPARKHCPQRYTANCVHPFASQYCNPPRPDVRAPPATGLAAATLAAAAAVLLRGI